MKFVDQRLLGETLGVTLLHHTIGRINIKKMEEFFRKIAHKTSEIVGSFWSFLAAIGVIAVWIVTGPLFNFSDTWQLVINTGTTIVTFLMVFLIQNTQNRDAKAIHLKIDELIRSQSKARNSFIELENLSDKDLRDLEEEFYHRFHKEVKKRNLKHPHTKPKTK